MRKLAKENEKEPLLLRYAELTPKGKEILRNVELGIKEIRVKVCKHCLKDAANKNIKAKSSPPPENWSAGAELWLCFRLRKDGKCPLDLPPISY